MKKILLTAAGLLFSIILNAQCNAYFPLEEGMSWVYESYNQKDQLTGKNEMTVSQFNPTSNGFTAIMESVIYDAKGKEISSGELEYSCEGGVVYVDMRRFVPQQQLSALGSYELEVKSENLEMPANLNEGLSLKDGSITISAANAPIPMNITVNITDRTVEAKEKIEVSAGIFDCYKIKSKSKMNMKMGMTINNEYSSVQWYAENVGMVKSETYDGNGKLTGYSVLISRK